MEDTKQRRPNRRRLLALAVCTACSSGNDGPSGPPGFSSGGETEASESETLPTSSISGTATVSDSTASTTDATESATSLPQTSSTTSTEGGTETMASTGEESCDAWARPLPGNQGRGFALGPDGTLLGVVNADAGPHMFAIDRCTGDILVDQIITDDGAGDLLLGDVVVLGARLFVTGNLRVTAGVDQSAYFAAFDYGGVGAGFTMVGGGAIGGGDPWTETFGLHVASDGDLWVAATRGASAPVAALLRASPNGTTCDFPAAGGVADRARAVAVNAGNVFLFTFQDAAAGVSASVFDESACACDCAPATTGTLLQVGTNATSVNAAVALNGQVYFAGQTRDDSTNEGFDALLGRVNSSGTALAFTRRPLTVAGDAYEEIATDGTDIYVAGVTGVENGQSFSEGSAVVEVYGVPLAVDAQPVRSFAASALGIVSALIVNEDTIFLAGTKDGAPVVLRCDKERGCS